MFSCLSAPLYCRIAALQPWSAVVNADSASRQLVQLQEGVMGRMQCLQSAVSPPAHWSISTTRLHARPKADAVKLKVSFIMSMEPAMHFCTSQKELLRNSSRKFAVHRLQIACLRMQNLSL